MHARRRQRALVGARGPVPPPGAVAVEREVPAEVGAVAVRPAPAVEPAAKGCTTPRRTDSASILSSTHRSDAKPPVGTLLGARRLKSSSIGGGISAPVASR